MVTVEGVSFWPREQRAVVAYQVMNLGDGSVVTLAKDAKIGYALADHDRKVTLLSGEATFKVAKN